VHLTVFAFTEPIVHQAVAEPDGIFAFGENHLDVPEDRNLISL
jgi:hypothetical protein